MQAWLVELYYKFTTYRAGLIKHKLEIKKDGSAAFSYTEKGTRNPNRPSIVFVHGLSSNKETWIPIVKNIPSDYHCITVDLPGHGETIGLNEDIYSIDKFVDKLKLFFDEMKMTEPMCIIGASMGGAIVCMFAIKYPQYVGMICLLAPIANEECETELIRQLRNGVYNALLPETPAQLRQMINTLTVKRVNLPRPFLNGFLHLRLRLLEEHRKVLTSLLEYDYPHIELHYQQLREFHRPALILWGRQDRVYAFSGAEYFSNLLPMAESVIFDDCGHFMAIDKPEETARSIIDFFDTHANNPIYSYLMGTGASAEKQPKSPYHRLLEAKKRKAKKGHYIDGVASNFYHHCANGDIDQVHRILEAPDRRPINELVKLEPNGNTALHAAAENGHVEVVKLLLENDCSRIILNRHGRVAAEEATTPDVKTLFIRSENSERFHDSDTNKTMIYYIPVSKETNINSNESDINKDKSHTANSTKLEYIQQFETKAQVEEFTLNHQTMAMWIRFYNWFSRTFPTFFQRPNLNLDSFKLHKNEDFKDFLEKKLGKRYQKTLKEFDQADKENSIEPLLTIYSSEELGFYKSLNKQLADSVAEADTSPHLCDRFIIEFHIRSAELQKRSHIGIVYRGATLELKDIPLYEKLPNNESRAIIAFKSFTSTSEKKKVALDFIVRSLPKEHQVSVLQIIDIDTISPTIVGMDDVSQHKGEEEILIMPGSLFTVEKIVKNVETPIGETTLPVTEIYLKYLHIPVSFWTKLRHTYQSATKDSVM